MNDKKLMVIFFVIGVLVFAWVGWEIYGDRSPVVELLSLEMVPNKVKAGQDFEAVWTEKLLRKDCGGIIFRRMLGMYNGREEVWAFPPARVVRHDKVGEVKTFHTRWKAPSMDAGTEAVFEKHINRWCNVFQEWFGPIKEVQEARFSMVN